MATPKSGFSRPAAPATQTEIGSTSRRGQSWLTIASPGFVNVPDCGNANAQSIEYALTAAAPLGGVAKVAGYRNVDDPQIEYRARLGLRRNGRPARSRSSRLPVQDDDLDRPGLDALTRRLRPHQLPARAGNLERRTMRDPTPRTQRRARQPSRTRGFRPARSTAIASRPTSRPAAVDRNVGQQLRGSTLRYDQLGEYATECFGCRSLERRVVRGRIRSRSRLLGRRWGRMANSSFPATLSALTGNLAAYDLGSQTATCSYTDAGGLSATASATYTIVDTTNPGISFVEQAPPRPT